MSRLLAIDTATTGCSVAYWCDGAVQANQYSEQPRAHAQLVLPMVDAVLTEAGCELADLDCLAFGQGPGSFTSVRIATALVQGLALGADLPCVGVSNLAALAQAAVRQHPRISEGDTIAVAFDARQQQVYCGAYQLVDGIVQAMQSEAVSDPQQVSWPEASTIWAVGEGWQVYADALAGEGEFAQLEQPLWTDAVDVVQLAAHALAQGEQPVAAWEVKPVYLRSQVAQRPTPTK